MNYSDLGRCRRASKYDYFQRSKNIFQNWAIQNHNKKSIKNFDKWYIIILGAIHKLRQIFRGEKGFMKTWHFLTRGEGGLPNIWRQKIVIFYAEILTKKVVLGCFFTSETSEIIQNSNFQMGWKSNQVITPTFPKNLEAFTCYE